MHMLWDEAEPGVNPFQSCCERETRASISLPHLLLARVPWESPLVKLRFALAPGTVEKQGLDSSGF